MMPLEGIRVLDLSRLAPGPYCSMLLGDMGADVLLVEVPPEAWVGRTQVRLDRRPLGDKWRDVLAGTLQTLAEAAEGAAGGSRSTAEGSASNP